MKPILAALIFSLFSVSTFASANWSDLDQKTFVIPSKEYCWIRLNVISENSEKSTVALTFEGGKVSDADPNFDRICKQDKSNLQFNCIKADSTQPCQGAPSNQHGTSIQITPKGALAVGFKGGSKTIFPPLGRTQCV